MLFNLLAKMFFKNFIKEALNSMVIAAYTLSIIILLRVVQ